MPLDEPPAQIPATSSLGSQPVVSSTTTKPLRKNVSFHNMVAMKPIPSVESFTKAEKKAAWHSVNDLQAIKSRERALRKKTPSSSSSSSSSLRDALKQEIGIESVVDVQKRRLRVDLRLCKVLDEQDKQWEKDIENPDELARLSSVTSQESMELAFKRAQDVAKQIDRNPPPLTRGGRSAGSMLLLSSSKRRSSRDLLAKFTLGGGGFASLNKKNATWGTAAAQNNMGMMGSHKSTGMMMMRSKLLGSSSSRSSGKNGNATWKVTTTNASEDEKEHEEDDTTLREEDDDPALYNPVVLPQQNPRIKSILRRSKISPVYQSSPALLSATTSNIQRPTPTRPFDKSNPLLNAISKPTSTPSSKNSMGNASWNNNSTNPQSPAGGAKPKYDLQKLAGLVGVPSPA